MKKIFFLMPQLGGGGAERVVSTLLRSLDKKKYSLNLLLIHNQGEFLKELPDHVNVIVLRASKSRYSIFEILQVLRKEKPDIVLSTIRGLSLLLMIIKPFLSRNTKVILREENTVSAALKETKFRKLWEIYYRKIFTKSDKIICQSKYMVEDLNSNFNVPLDKMIQIYNPVDFKYIKSKLNDSVNPFENNIRKKNVVVIGRFAYQKGLDLLIDSINSYKEKLSDVTIWLVGDGELKQEYIQKINNYNIQDLIKLPGKTNNPFAWMKYADLFLLVSRYEGLPNVLIEAAVCEVNTIVTNHPGGTSEIMDMIGRGYAVVETLNWDTQWFEKQSDINMEQLQGNFAVNNIKNKYELLFDSL